LALRLLVPVGPATSTGGRPPAQVAFNAGAATVLSIDLGATHATIALTDLNAKVISQRSVALDIAEGPHAVLDVALGLGKELLEQVDVPVIGIGIGVPGPVEHSTGRPISPPIMPGWDGFDIPAYVRQSIDVTVLVDNDVNILALGEHATSWPDVDDLVFVKVATGIGAGVISSGSLQRGSQGAAGDMGHVQVPYSRDSPRPPEDERDLEAIASGTAIAKQLTASGLKAESAADVADLVRSGDARAIEATRQAGREIGEVLSVVVSMLNPSVIVVGGSVARAGEHLLAGIKEIVYRRSIPLATQHLSIVPSQSGERAAVVGAAIMVANRALSPAAIDQFAAQDLGSPSARVRVL